MRHSRKSISALALPVLTRRCTWASVAVKHYLRGEDGIFYEDLYHLVKFLPAYELPAGRPSMNPHESKVNLASIPETSLPMEPPRRSSMVLTRPETLSPHAPNAKRYSRRYSSQIPPSAFRPVSLGNGSPASFKPRPPAITIDTNTPPNAQKSTSPILPTAHSWKAGSTNGFLLPARDPPPYALFDVFPFSLCVRELVKRGKDVKGRRALRARARDLTINHNIPLEIAFYIVRACMTSSTVLS